MILSRVRAIRSLENSYERGFDMGILSRILAASIFAGLACGQAFGDDFPLKGCVECSPRDGLPNFFEKLEKGGDVNVAYLGGSITAQNGWRVKSLANFQKEYPQAKLHEINAAIGGTGSNLGVFRIDHDVFAFKPDLLFVEFAVNDGGAAPAEIVKSMEGIVRKTWKEFPSCDICFVYTITEGNANGELKDGKMSRSASVMESIADHYGIPSVHMGVEIAKLLKEGKLVMKSADAKVEKVSGDELNESAKLSVDSEGRIPFSKDGVHPYPETGHVLYMKAIARSLGPIKAASVKPGPHSPLQAPLDAENLENTVMLPLEKAELSGPWTKLPEDKGMGANFRKFVPSLWKGEPGAELSFKFKGSRAMVYDLMSFDSGKLEISVDGKVSTAQRIDGYCTYSRLATLSLGSGLDPEKVHEVKVKVLGDKLDKAKILFEHNRKDLEGNPAKYEPCNWYAGAIFLVGGLAD